MHKRIKDLKRQAEEYAGKYGLAHSVYGQDLIDILDQKFAELIVRECLTVITPTEIHTGSYVDFSNGMKLSQSLIKKHFGVN